MFKYFSDSDIEDGKTFADHTLFLPSVSVGNVGQLATDVLLANAGPPFPIKIGRVFHPGIEAVVGTDPCSDNGDPSKLVTSCEIFRIPDKKFVVIHFHAPVTMKKRAEFVEFLCGWIKRQNFKQVICLSSTFASDRNDRQLCGVPLRYIASGDFDSALIEKLKSLEWQRLEKRQFPAPAVIDADSPENENGELYIPGSGITMQLYEKCQEIQVPFLALIMFASEGDNTPEALTMFDSVNKLFLIGSKKLSDKNESVSLQDIKIPLTWGHFHGRSHPVELY